MKKPVKIILIVALTAIGLYTIRLAYGFLILSVVKSDAVSSEDHLEIAQALYEKCKEKEQDDCEYNLAQDLLDVFAKQRKEAMAVVLDNTKSEAERVEALKTFYELSRAGENKPIDKEEALLYYAVAYIDEDPIPVDLSSTAFEYLLKSPVNDPRIVQALMIVAGDTNMSAEFRAQAIKSLGEAGVEGVGDIAIQALADENWQVRFNASEALSQIGDDKYIPELLKIAIDIRKEPSARSMAIDTIESMFRNHGIQSDQSIDMLRPLLDDEHYTVRSAAASALEEFTGKEYEIVPGTEEELQYFFFE